LYAFGQFIFIDTLSGTGNLYPHVSLWIAVFFFLLPIKPCIRRFEGDVDRDDDETYTKNKRVFMDDYDRSNPVTSKEATLQHLDALAATERSEDKLAKLKIQRLLVVKGGDYGSMKTYAGGENTMANKATEIFKRNTGFKVPSVVKIEQDKDSDSCIEGEQNRILKNNFFPPINLRNGVPLQ
jgi:hypothetical protein